MFPNKGIPGGCGIGVVMAVSDTTWIQVIEIPWKWRAVRGTRGKCIVACMKAASLLALFLNRTCSVAQFPVGFVRATPYRVWTTQTASVLDCWYFGATQIVLHLA